MTNLTRSRTILLFFLLIGTCNASDVSIAGKFHDAGIGRTSTLHLNRPTSMSSGLDSLLPSTIRSLHVTGGGPPDKNKNKDKNKSNDKAKSNTTKIKDAVAFNPANLPVALHIAGWYCFNILYNIYNKQTMNFLEYPWTIATLHMATGTIYFGILCLAGLREPIKPLDVSELKTLLPVSLCHTGVHVGAVMALGCGSLALVHLGKALEPLLTCGLSVALFGPGSIPQNLYPALIPISLGIALSSVKQRQLAFTIPALFCALLSSLSSAARGILAKNVLAVSTDVSKKSPTPSPIPMDAPTLYGIVTILSTAILIPIMLIMEGASMFRAILSGPNADTSSSRPSAGTLLMLLAVGGISYSLYNEASFFTLDQVTPLTHSIGSTIKRAVILMISVIAFQTPVSGKSMLGSIMAILGTMLYAFLANDQTSSPSLKTKKK